MKHYLIDEFIGEHKPTTLAEEIEKKISLLYDFYILVHKKARECDPREEALRQILSSYKNETTMNNVVHDLLVGNITLDRLLALKMLQ